MGATVITRGDAPPVLETAEAALNDIAPLVGGWIEGLDALSGRVVGNDWPGAALDEEASECVAVIGGVCGAQQTWWKRRDEVRCNGRVAALARRYLERDGAAATVDNSMDFCRQASSASPNGLGFAPPFAPAEC